MMSFTSEQQGANPISQWSNQQLRDALMERGLSIGPVTPSTRALYESKMLKLISTDVGKDQEADIDEVATEVITPMRSRNGSPALSGSPLRLSAEPELNRMGRLGSPLSTKTLGTNGTSGAIRLMSPGRDGLVRASPIRNPASPPRETAAGGGGGAAMNDTSDIFTMIGGGKEKSPSPNGVGGLSDSDSSSNSNASHHDAPANHQAMAEGGGEADDDENQETVRYLSSWETAQFRKRLSSGTSRGMTNVYGSGGAEQYYRGKRYSGSPLSSREGHQLNSTSYLFNTIGGGGAYGGGRSKAMQITIPVAMILLLGALAGAVKFYLGY